MYIRKWLEEAEEAERVEGVVEVEVGEEDFQTLKFKTR